MVQAAAPAWMGGMYVIVTATSMNAWIYLAVILVYRRAVRGSRIRYVTGSLVPVLLLGVVVNSATRVVTNLYEEKWLWAAVWAVLAAVYVWMYETRDKSDDDFWKSSKRRLKRWARTRQTRRAGMLAPQT